VGSPLRILYAFGPAGVSLSLLIVKHSGRCGGLDEVVGNEWKLYLISYVLLKRVYAACNKHCWMRVVNS